MAFDLSAAVKRKLNITWSDDGTDARVADVIATCTPAVARVVGLPIDTDAFDTAGEDTGLLVNACFYEWNHALDEFWANYADDIQRARIRHETESYEAELEAADAE